MRELHFGVSNPINDNYDPGKPKAKEEETIEMNNLYEYKIIGVNDGHIRTIHKCDTKEEAELLLKTCRQEWRESIYYSDKINRIYFINEVFKQSSRNELEKRISELVHDSDKEWAVEQILDIINNYDQS